MTFIILAAILLVVVLVLLVFKPSKQITNVIPEAEETLSSKTFSSVDPKFSFNYPSASAGYNLEVDTSSVVYSPKSTELLGPVSASFSWDKIFIKVAEGYWEAKPVNKNGVSYHLSEDRKTLDFRLTSQGGAVIRFNLFLYGSSIRQTNIINTIVDSFSEEA